jgi:PTH1 family peptidyl-tRNA hydrolase
MFMNLSGESVQAAAASLRVPPEGIILVHDEIDLPWRRVRLKAGAGQAGHNGIRSVIQRLGSPDFVPVRVGIGRPPSGFRGEVSEWVLSNFDPHESAELPLVVEAAASAIRRAVDGGLSPMRSQ